MAEVRRSIGPVAAFRQVIIVPKLPKTRSGKVARNTLSDMAAGKPYKVRLMCTLLVSYWLRDQVLARLC